MLILCYMFKPWASASVDSCQRSLSMAFDCFFGLECCSSLHLTFWNSVDADLSFFNYEGHESR